MGCQCCKPYSPKKMYIREIFDAIDSNGTRTIDAAELRLVWDLVRRHKIANLQKERAQWVALKNNEIQAMEQLPPTSVLKRGSVFKLKDFAEMMDELNLSKPQLREFWLETKKKEIREMERLVERLESETTGRSPSPKYAVRS
jgi:hypothetical protein